MEKILPGLIQKALNDANALHEAIRIGPDGNVWKRGSYGFWIRTGVLMNSRDAEDFLLSKLTQEDRLDTR